MTHCVVQAAQCPPAKHVLNRQRAITRARANSKQQVAAGLPTEAELIWAVESLRRDQLRPCSRILRLRLAEQPEPRGSELRSCEANRLRSLCAASPALCVQTCNAGEWYVTLRGHSSDCIDVYSEEDVFSEDLWRAAEAYFTSLEEVKEHTLPRGRYASARALVARRLPFLEGLTLGQVCHFVQIAISKRKILGYIDGGIVPYAWSVSMVKSRCAQRRCPLPVPASVGIQVKSERMVADWPSARAKLREILETKADRGQDQVQLSNVKRLFRSLYGIELSETALGHTTLTGLLGDPRLRDVCSVQVHGRGHVVVPATPQSPPMTPPPHASLQAISPLMTIRTTPPVERTFIHFGPHFPSADGCPVPSAMRRWRSLPASLGSTIANLTEQRRCTMSNLGEPDADSSSDCSSGSNMWVTPVPTLPGSSREGASVLSTNSGGERSSADSDEERYPTFCPDEPICLEGFMMPSSSVPVAPPSPLYPSETMSSNEASEREEWEATCLALGIKPIEHDYTSFHAAAGVAQAAVVDKSGERPRTEPPQFCSNEVPLVLEEEEDEMERRGLPEESLCPLRTPSPLCSSSRFACPWMKHQDYDEHNYNRHASCDEAGHEEASTGHVLNTADGLSDCTEHFSEHPRMVPCMPRQETIVLRLACMI